MTRQARVKSSTGVYHVIVRGANKQAIFHDDADCRMFLDALHKYKRRTDLKVFAWCLMNNHAHLLIKEGHESISATMKRVGVSYVSYYNEKYETTGHLFQDRFRSENVETRGYLLTVTRYIHQNPVKAGMVKKPDDWEWSSCAEYYGEITYPRGLLDQSYILELFSPDHAVGMREFKVFNEAFNSDECLEERVEKRRLSDDEARTQIKKLLCNLKIAQVKSLPKKQRDEILREMKSIDRISQRQAARILGISPNLFYKA
ncbi:transposase [Bacillus sp. HMF5848]|uniref:REP-associated tyrosine transposase n=1 Tax=Bacillus sp. HMF5848 TaxID=2495421 RepID=UPI000F78A65B|nr:transposase [Bacillus sp. HMF5848]RSK28769.1 transposase [Bacillus sp. HMF5848]